MLPLGLGGLLICLSWTLGEAYYPMVISKPGYCKETKLMEVKVYIRDTTCWGVGHGSQDGTDKFGSDNTVACIVDICAVPPSGKVADGHVWGISLPSNSRNASSDDRVMVMKMKRDVCEYLTGRRYVVEQDDVYCEMRLIRQWGGDRKNLNDALFFAGTNKCPSPTTAASGVVGIRNKDGSTQTMCKKLHGSMAGSECVFDLCYTSAISCSPTDGYVVQQTCRHEADGQGAAIKCVYEMTTGVSMSRGQETTIGAEVGVEVSVTVGMELMEIFSSEMSVSMSASFSWSNTLSLETTFTESSKRQVEVTVRPGYEARIEQLVGTCGPYRVSTNEYVIKKLKITA